MTESRIPLSLLAGDEAGPMLQAALASAGLVLEDWRVDMSYDRPGAETSVGYDVLAGGTRLYVIASTVSLDADDARSIGAVRLDSEAGSVHVWVHPADPRLPGLRDACTVAGASALLGGADIASLRLRVLRPLRRAVVEVVSRGPEGERAQFLKVVRPDRVGDLLERHRSTPLAPAVRDLGTGVVLLDEAPGRPMGLALADSRRIAPASLTSALAAFDDSAVSLPMRPSWAARLPRYGPPAGIRSGDPALAARVAGRISHLDSGIEQPVVPTHGDFHPGNVFVEEGRAVAALIDLDTVGPGHRVDDYACMLAHLECLPEGGATEATIAECRQAWSQECGRELLAARTAAVLVSLAASAPSSEEALRRLRLAERLV